MPRQSEAHSRRTDAQVLRHSSFIASQARAQSSQCFAQDSATLAQVSEPVAAMSEVTWQSWAHSASMRQSLASASFPPFLRHICIVCRLFVRHSEQEVQQSIIFLFMASPINVFGAVFIPSHGGDSADYRPGAGGGGITGVSTIRTGIV